MTDLATEPEADQASTEAETVDAPVAPEGPGGETPSYAWAPAEPAPRKRRTALWIGLGAGATVIALVAASLVLIAPGTRVGGVDVGLRTQGAAVDALQSHLDATTIVLTGAGGDAEVTGADLGATVDTRALAEQAFAERPAWNLGAWNGDPIDVVVDLDPEVATAALREAAPDLYTDPTDATLAYNPATASYATTAGVDGEGIDVEAVRAALQDAVDSGATSVEVEPVLSPVTPAITTATADTTVAQLNTLLAGVGFYVGDERTVPVSPDVAASWLTVTPDDDGTFAISADEEAIQAVVDTLPAAVNREVVNATVITNTAGTVLKEVSTGAAGRTVGDTSSLASDFAAQLATGNAAIQVPVDEVAFTNTALARTVEIDLSAQRAYLYENGQLVKDIIIASGTSATPTPQGRFTVFGYSRVQSMGCYEGAPYCVRDVPYATWFAPDIAFHGANALRSRLGYPQSHGCVNMWDADAKFVYDWTVRGTEVWVHA